MILIINHLDPQQQTANRSELFASHATDARRRVGNLAGASSSTSDVSESPFRTASPFAATEEARQAHALREHAFAHTANAQLDDFIAQGRAALDNLVDQRHMLKGTQRRLLDTANTLGLSRQVIGWIERRRYVDERGRGARLCG
jgi:golgi SNAP receptor complex member 2